MPELQNRKAPEELSVLELFSGVEYVVPIYQRNYAWGATEIEQLIEDIIDSENVYYLGSLIVDKKGANVYEVIDGQQRLTTLFLLMRWLEENVSEHTIQLNRTALQFEAREKSNRTLREIKKDFQGSEWYSNEIVDGFHIIEKYFKKKEEESKVSANKDSFTEKFKSRLSDIKIIRTQVPDNIDLNHYFEIMNTRGEQLELHEIVKAKLLEKVEDKDKEIVSIVWDACSRMDSYVQMNFTKEIRRKIFGWYWEDFAISSFNELLEKIGDLGKASEGKAKLLDIIKNKAIIDNTAENEKEESERFESIISFSHFLLQVNAAMSNETEEIETILDDKRMLDLLQRHWVTRESAQHFIYSMLKYRYLFDKYIIKREFAKNYKDEGRWSLKRLKLSTDMKKANFVLTYGKEENDESENNNQVKMLQSCLRVTYTSPKTMHWISKILHALQKNAALDQIRFLEKYASEKVIQSKYDEASGFGFSRIAFTYLDYLLWRNDRKKFNDFQFQFRTSIEHFYPQHPVNGNEWEEFVLNDFGNLALLTVSANSKFSNLLPASKVESFKEVVQQSPKLMLMEELIGADGWNQAKAKQHGNEMKDILRKAIKN